MSYNVNDVLEFQLKWKSTKWAGETWRNRLKYRGTAGELDYSSAEDLTTAFLTTVVNRILNQHLASTYLATVRLINVTRLGTPEFTKDFGEEDYPGIFLAGSNEIAQASACITRKAWSRGRKAIGRYFHGPLPERFVDGGLAVKDPTGAGDLQDVCDALGDPISFAGFTARPVILGDNLTTANAGNEVRTNVVAPLVTYLKTRRIGKGE